MGKVGQDLLNDLVSGKDLSNLEKILDDTKNYYFKARFASWDKNSYYPSVEVTGKIGLTGDIEIEC